MTLPLVVVTDRLRLELWDAPTVTAIRAGERRAGWHPSFPRKDDADSEAGPDTGAPGGTGDLRVTGQLGERCLARRDLGPWVVGVPGEDARGHSGQSCEDG